MQKSAYKVKIGSATLDSSISPEIISISVDLDLNVPSDSFKIILKPGTKASNIRNGDPVIIELGYEDALNRVLTGTVDTIEPKISEVAISGLSLISTLASQRINQVYEKQSTGSIVKDLASRAGIAVKEVEEGISLPMYVIDDTKDVYTHLKELARKCGFDMFMSGEGKLIFKKYTRQTPKPFNYGRDIIEAEVSESTPIAACVKVYGESPSSFKGADTAHWITKKVVEGVAGSGDVTFLIEDPVIRDKDSADKAATAFLETILTKLSGTLKVLGNSCVGLGDTIEIKDMPDNRMNGEFEAVSVGHFFNKAEGFVSIIGWVKKVTIFIAEAPLAAPPPLSLPAKPPSAIEEQLETLPEQEEETTEKPEEIILTTETIGSDTPTDSNFSFLIEIVDDKKNPIKEVAFNYKVDEEETKTDITDKSGILNVKSQKPPKIIKLYFEKHE